jgi:hypothetical protein
MPEGTMQFLTIRELSKAPRAALSKLAQDGKAVLTNNGKPAAIMITVNAENFERVFNAVQQAEKPAPAARVQPPALSEKERDEAFERLMNFPKRLPADFDYKKELIEAIDERFGPID